MANQGSFLQNFGNSSAKVGATSELLNFINANQAEVIGNAGDPAQYKLLYDLGLRYLDKQFSPHINGFYYVSVESGTWVNHIPNTDESNFPDDYKLALSDFKNNCSSYITDIDTPNLTMEFDSISGKARSINYATKTSYSSDFSLSIINDYNNYCMKYLDCHFQFMTKYKKGDIEIKDVSYLKNTNYRFTNVPYFDAVWIAIFKPFTFKIDCLIKLVGVAPVTFPFKQIIGDRTKSAISTVNINYKSSDMFYKFYGETANGALYEEFIKHLNSKK
jgi:hypothetical protein